MKPQRRLLNQPTARTTPPSMPTTTNERTNQRQEIDRDTRRSCLLAAQRIALEAEHLKHFFSHSYSSPTLTQSINVALELIDNQMAYLTDVMAAIPTQPDHEAP